MCEGGESLFRLSRKILHWHRWWYPCLSSAQKRTFHGDGVDEEEIGGAVVHHQSVSDVGEAPALIFSTCGLVYPWLCKCADKHACVAYTCRRERTRGGDEMNAKISTRSAPSRFTCKRNRRTNQPCALTGVGLRDVELSDHFQRLRVVRVTFVRPPPAHAQRLQMSCGKNNKTILLQDKS